MTKQEYAKKMDDAGVSRPDIARHFGVSPQTIYRWLDPEYAERSRSQSREAKRRRTGSCVECGATTRYNGRHGLGVSETCAECSKKIHKRPIEWTRELIVARIREWAGIYGEPPASADWNPWHSRYALGDTDRARRFLAADGYWPTQTTVYRRFATWGEALEAAGFTARAPHGGDGNQLRRRSVRSSLDTRQQLAA